MSTIKSTWKVVPTSKTGSQAPTYFVETQYVVINSRTKRENYEKEYSLALIKAKKHSRLSDFPETWNFEIEKV